MNSLNGFLFRDKIDMNRSASNKGGKLYFIADDEVTDDCSSTLIRERIRKKQDVDDLTYPSVVHYLKKNSFLSPK
jgi:nicotinic acid mononucleotide adenylyltransferase